MSLYNLLYVGPTPPADFRGLLPIDTDLDDNALAVRKAEAEVEQGVECFVVVDDGVARRTWSFPQADAPPKPNTPNNPYFGKKILQTKDFYAIAGQVLGSRYARLRKDDAFLWVADALNKIDFVNVDDKSGQFLGIVGYLTTTNATDGQKLMSAQDVTNIMAAWPKA